MAAGFDNAGFEAGDMQNWFETGPNYSGSGSTGVVEVNTAAKQTGNYGLQVQFDPPDINCEATYEFGQVVSSNFITISFSFKIDVANLGGGNYMANITAYLSTVEDRVVVYNTNISDVTDWITITIDREDVDLEGQTWDPEGTELSIKVYMSGLS